jgi:hypothetical protein
MCFDLPRFAFSIMLAALLAGCAATPSASRQPRSVAIIMSGDVVAYGAQSLGTTISIVDVDGARVAEPYGPVELKPGKHTVTLKCDGATTAQNVNVRAGEVYQFAKSSPPGAKGCTGSLSRIRTANP